MKSFNQQEYLALVQQLTDLQYQDDEPEAIATEWIPSTSPLKEKVLGSISNKIIDLTDIKSVDIKNLISQSTRFKIGLYTLQIKINASSKSGSISIWEEKSKTPNGMPCKVDYPLAIKRDTRFANCQWSKHFGGHCAYNVPVDVIVEIIRWLQVSLKISAFF